MSIESGLRPGVNSIGAWPWDTERENKPPTKTRDTMCNVATAVENVITFEQCTIYQGVTYIEVAIDANDPYGSFKKLPAAIEFGGVVLGKTCFNSDKNLAYYRSDAKNVARIVRG